MNFRLLCCVGMGCFTTYIGIVMLVMHLRPREVSPPPKKPNFHSREAVVVDKETGEKTIFREFTISTKLAE